MMYKVVKAFTDLQDDRHVYNAGDTFPRGGVDVSEERLKELSSTSNKLGVPLIKAEEPAGEKPSKEAEPAETEEETAEVSEPEAEEGKPKKTSKKKRGGNAD